MIYGNIYDELIWGRFKPDFISEDNYFIATHSFDRFTAIKNYAALHSVFNLHAECSVDRSSLTINKNKGFTITCEWSCHANNAIHEYHNVLHGELITHLSPHVHVDDHVYFASNSNRYNFISVWHIY